MRHKHRESDEAIINITPMLDIVFIMLIFFIVTTSFIKETGIDPQRPTAQTAASKPRGNILLDQLASKLQAALPDVTFNRYAKPTFAKPAPEDLRKKIRQENGFVIEALAD